jgi:hypothetical protein
LFSVTVLSLHGIVFALRLLSGSLVRPRGCQGAAGPNRTFAQFVMFAEIAVVDLLD